MAALERVDDSWRAFTETDGRVIKAISANLTYQSRSIPILHWLLRRAYYNDGTKPLN